MKRALTLVVLVALAASPAIVLSQPVSKPPTVPMPETGTLALASLGLLTLGITLRRRRGR